MAKKLPAFQFYGGDWKKDPCVGSCCAATRGIWLEMLLAMHEDDRSGELTGRVDRLARLARCDVSEMIDALRELSETETADVFVECHGVCQECHADVTVDKDAVVTVVNRRMQREAKERNSSKERKKRQRNGGKDATVTDDGGGCHGESHADVTDLSHPLSSSSVSSSSSESPPVSPKAKSSSGTLPGIDCDQNELTESADAGLLAAIEWWNSMAAAKLVSHRVVDPMGKGVQAAWKAFQRDRHRQEWLSDRAAVRSKIEQSPICREGWFRFEKLFSGNNPQSIPIAQLVSEGAYVKSATKPKSIGGDPGKCYPGDSWT